MRQFTTVVLLTTYIGCASVASCHAWSETNEQLDAFDTFVNTNELLAHMRELRAEMHARIQEERDRAVRNTVPGIPDARTCKECPPADGYGVPGEEYEFNRE